ncbi:MAG: DUF6364 family protein [Flavobacteriales bacterium]|nr:DUF6364 family protein [Flavobacteriales bacterium]
MSKTKLTLSVEESTVRKAKAAGKRSGKSVSELFTEAVERSTSQAPRRSWSAKWGGTLTFTDADLLRDDRVGRMARKVRTKPTRTNKVKRA